MPGDFSTSQMQMKRPQWSAYDDSLTHIEKYTSESSGKQHFLNKLLEVELGDIYQVFIVYLWLYY